MIGKLRKKLMIVLMAVVFLFMVGILSGLFISSKTDYERRSVGAFRDPRAFNPTEKPGDPDFTATPFAVVTVDAEGSITVNQNQIYYVTEEELTEITRRLLEEDANGGLTSDYELRYRRHVDNEGTTRFFFSDTFIERSSLNAQLLYSAIIGLGALGLFFVVSLLLARWMTRPVEKAWEKQRQFIADASHELKTPLTVVLSNTDMLIASQAVTDEKNRRRLDNIRAESQRMKGLVESLLTLARSDSGGEAIAREPVNFSYVVTCSTLTLEPVIYDQGRSIESHVTENLTVLGDAGKLRQLVDILLDNACKYGNDGSVITVGLSATGKKELLLTVTSEGAPLPPEECTSIFERFYRSDKSRGQEKGYGLGLAIAQSIVKQHGGKIWASSDGERTNTFSVKLNCQ